MIEDVSNIEKMKKIQDEYNSAYDARQSLEKELAKLVLKVERGEPLLGGCDLCPKVYILAQ